MRILKTQTLRGPNYWSIRYPNLILMRLDLEDLADRPSDQIPGFYEALVETLPSLIEHFCSPGHRGGFLSRVRQGTYMGHIVEHVALELQTMAGMPVGFGRTRSVVETGVYQVVFEYQNEQAGRYAARAAVRLCNSLIETGHYSKTELEQDLADLAEFRLDAALGPSTEAIVRAAEIQDIPWMQLSTRAMIQLGYGRYQQRVQATLSSKTSILAVELASDKEGTKQILRNAGVPVPRGTVINYLDELENAIEAVGGYPIVIKPLDGNHGRGITIDIDTFEAAEEAYEAAREVSSGVIVERFYQGRDHRVLVINGRVIAVAERVPAHVVGDGKSTIEQLIDITNQDPRRGVGHDNLLTRIEVDRTTWQLLDRKGYTLDTVLPAGEMCYLRATANLSTGGIAIDRTDDIHPDNIWVAQRIAKTIGLDIAGIDVVTTDISKPLREVDGVIVEVNAAPGLRMHVCPSVGIARNVAEPILAMLFPPGQPARIPVVAITGTNGKTTTTRLTAHIFKQTGQMVGFTTTDGIYIGDNMVEPGDTTGPQSAQVILQDPTVEVAVLETARGGILRSGLAFKDCDIGMVLNVAADHMGLGDIETLEDMAHLKGVVAETVRPSGYAVLNADDPLVAAMAQKVKSQVAYFSMDPHNELVRKHSQQGGLAAVYEQGYLSILKGDWLLRIEQADKVPLTMGGKAPFQIANALAASLAAFAQGVDIGYIRQALHTFEASTDQTPGRMNLFNLGRFHALVDYAHNPASYEALGGFVKNWPGKRIGVVGGPGDRRDDDFISLGKLAAQMFDDIVVKEDDDTRGRGRGDAAKWIIHGIEEGVGHASYRIILDETEAINTALDGAEDDSLVVILPETVTRAIALIKARNPLPAVNPELNGVAELRTAPFDQYAQVHP
ncbi:MULTISPECIES: cyanophycin synthetase [Cyanophyceae]|uniref:cyanophycin synthetase n=1 Tax=Cyanophyceae TaxID=3028117 RepID=UPI001687AD7B|nr:MULTISPECIES: cyanophycin synthetase [Cyanophyceae]MBD1915268.1 cyanophycin synthetase [Phormidium sp. FACHB-77]MBD2032455.1 cyanophycin synthetase [Phormidium sp. FACHB-322]MBD2051014.1 cyanophycin synthetase [Leptolyngbya sp. FACHB-60]